MAALTAPSPSRWAIAVLLFFGCSLLYGTALLDEPSSGDERHWMVEATNVWRLVSRGRFDDPFWSGNHLLWGYASPSVSKCLMGIGMAAVGQGDPQAVTPPFSLEIAREWPPPPEALRAGRLSSVVLGALAVATLFLFIARELPTRIAASAALLLATSPVWCSICRRALTDIHGVGLSLLVLPLYASARDADLAKHTWLARLARWTAVGAIAGLSVGCKFSAAGGALGLAVLLVLEGFRPAGNGRGRFRDVSAALGIAALCTIVAVAVFILTYPYLWPDPVGRLRGILVLWRSVRESHATMQLGDFAGSFQPGPHSFSVAANLLLLPGGKLSWALLPALLGALWLRWKLVSPDAARIAVWALALPVLMTGALAGARNVQGWAVWAGLVGGTLSAVAVRGSLRRVASTANVSILTAAAVGAAAIIVLTTYIAWQRYYAPLLPALAVAAALGFDDLRRSVAALAGGVSARWVDAGVVAGMLTILAAFPRISRAKMSLVASHDLGVVPATLQGMAAICLALAVVAGLRGLSRRPQSNPSQEAAAAPR